MSRPAINSIALNANLTLSECHPDSECRTVSWWLYDERRGMNLAMRAKTRDAAFVEALEYWAARALEYEQAYASLKAQVGSFVGQFVQPEDETRD